DRNLQALRLLDIGLAFRCHFENTVIFNFLFQQTGEQRLAKNGIPEDLTLFFAGSITLKTVESEFGHFLAVFADKEIDNHFGGIAFLQSQNCLQGCFDFVFNFMLFLWIAAVVAHAAAIFVIVVFTKIMQQEFSSATTGFGIGNHFFEKLPAHFAFSYRLVAQKFLQLVYILGRVK